MKILHCSYSAHPDPAGGTEVYVAALCRALRAYGVESVVAAPAARDESLVADDVRIRKYAVSPSPDLETLYGVDAQASVRFVKILDEEQPDVLHQHALTPACSSDFSRHAKARGIPVVFTYHTPTVTCQRGTLMEWGTTPCDGRLDVARCTACSLQGLGAGVSASRLLAQVPDAGGRLLGTLGLSGGAWTALRMSSLLSARHHDVLELFERVDRIVVLAPWVAGLLRGNGVAEEKLVPSLHGIEQQRPPIAGRRREKAPLRVAHLGRLDPTKGTMLLVEALQHIPETDISLDIFGVVQNGGGPLVEALAQAASEDPRVHLHPAIAHADVIATLRDFDIVAVPSQWMETGPLVALEAFAAGVPVVGSALGGLADKIRHDENGLLVRPHDSVDAWREALQRCRGNRALVARLAAGVSRPKSMDDVAGEMHAIYVDLVDRHTAVHAALTASPRH